MVITKYIVNNQILNYAELEINYPELTKIIDPKYRILRDKVNKKTKIGFKSEIIANLDIGTYEVNLNIEYVSI